MEGVCNLPVDNDTIMGIRQPQQRLQQKRALNLDKVGILLIAFSSWVIVRRWSLDGIAHALHLMSGTCHAYKPRIEAYLRRLQHQQTRNEQRPVLLGF